MVRILIGILIIAITVTAVFLLRDYDAQSAAADSITAQVEKDSAVLTGTLKLTQQANADAAALARSLTDMERDIEAEKNVIPERVNSNEIVRSVLTLGQDINVIPLSTQEWKTVKVGKQDYSLFTMSVKVTGDQKLLMDYVRKVGSLYRTLIVESLTVTRPPKAEEDTVQAELKLAMYAR